MVAYTSEDVETQLARLRRACLGLPQTSERPSHGGPAFFIREKKCFVMFLDDHHEDGRLAIWCAAPDGVQVEVVETDPERFFRPPYVGHRGWLGVHLMTVGEAELTAIVTEAFRTVASPTVLRELDAD
ncbi:MAG TPA: MmcQ/YjbR family DNA-binding protein [Microlunatus sp.]